jgi:acetyl-CoA C-acetyltransferase
MALADRADPAFLDAVEKSAQRAYAMAGIQPKDIDVAEVHDCFAIAEICALEAMRLTEGCNPVQAARSGYTALGGKRPVNTSGGLKSKGHPVGASGVAQAIEIFEQLRGEAGERQVAGAHRGATQNMGGSGASSVVHIFERV